MPLIGIPGEKYCPLKKQTKDEDFDRTVLTGLTHPNTLFIIYLPRGLISAQFQTHLQLVLNIRRLQSSARFRKSGIQHQSKNDASEIERIKNAGIRNFQKLELADSPAVL